MPRPRDPDWDDDVVDPMWAISTADDTGMDVEEFLAEYNIRLPTED